MFSLDNKQREKVQKWLDSKPTPPDTAIGGALTYSFTPTTLGIVTKVKYYDGSELDVTDYEMW